MRRITAQLAMAITLCATAPMRTFAQSSLVAPPMAPPQPFVLRLPAAPVRPSAPVRPPENPVRQPPAEPIQRYQPSARPLEPAETVTRPRPTTRLYRQNIEAMRERLRSMGYICPPQQPCYDPRDRRSSIAQPQFVQLWWVEPSGPDRSNPSQIRVTPTWVDRRESPFPSADVTAIFIDLALPVVLSI